MLLRHHLLTHGAVIHRQARRHTITLHICCPFDSTIYPFVTGILLDSPYPRISVVGLISDISAHHRLDVKGELGNMQSEAHNIEGGNLREWVKKKH